MKKQLLIIDDQAATRKLLGHYLGNAYDVITMDSMLAAISWLDQGNEPDAIVADIIMTEMSGIEFLSYLHSNGRSMPPVMMLSGVENSSEKLKCFNLGVRDYLVKPFNPEELRMRILNLIKN
jgi:DNA-binding response OmpR family regulator